MSYARHLFHLLTLLSVFYAGGCATYEFSPHAVSADTPVQVASQFADAVRTGRAQAAWSLFTDFSRAHVRPEDALSTPTALTVSSANALRTESLQVSEDGLNASVPIEVTMPDVEGFLLSRLGDSPELSARIGGPPLGMSPLVDEAAIPARATNFILTLVREGNRWGIDAGTSRYLDAITTEVEEFPAQRLVVSAALSRAPVLASLKPAYIDAPADLLSISLHNLRGALPLLNGVSRQLPIEIKADLASDRPTMAVSSTSSERFTFIGKVHVEDAYMLRARLRLNELSRDSKIWVWGSDQSEARQLALSNPGQEELWTPMVAGDTLWLQLETGSREGELTISDVLELFELDEARLPIVRGVRWMEPVSQPLSPGGYTAVDSTCKDQTNTRYSNTQDLVRQFESATVMLAHVLSSPGGGYVGGFCSGTRIASRKDPTGFYILTANHCFVGGKTPPTRNATDSEVSSTEVIWDYRTPTCNTTGPVRFPSTELLRLPRSSGAKLLSARFQSDSVLFNVNPVAGRRTALGWQLGLSYANDAFTHRVSHPALMSQAYALQMVDFIENLDYCSSVGLPKQEYFYALQMEGDTEPGSSGSAIVTQNLRIVGQLYGTCYFCRKNCFHTRVDGDLSRSWVEFSKYLD